MRKIVIGIIFVMFFILMAGDIFAASKLKIKHLVHEPDNVRFCYMTKDGELNLRLQVQRQGVDRAELILDGREKLPMKFYAENNFYQFYAIQFKPEKEEFTYYFKVTVGEEVAYLGQNGAVTSVDEIEPFVIYTNSVQTFATPDWAKGAVIYQIFPERFYNGDPSNDPKPGEWDVYGNPVVVRSWDQYPVNPPRGSDFFGGDLQGVLDKLDYLEELGVQAIYFNPIHESISNHKYDATDYLKVDDNFGTNELFKKLVKEAKKRGIYIIIDGVFNHTGTEFWAFQDIIKNGEDSPYVDWYRIYSFPVSPEKGNYDCWNGFSSLPELNYKNPEVREYILDVVRYWLSLGVKGIRLDAPKEVPHEFWQELYRVAKEIDPEVLIIGEIWDDASPWINNKEFDSTMNYVYRKLMIKFFIERIKRPSRFAKELGMDLTRYPEPVVHVLYNMVSSHDVERFLTLARGNVDLIKPFVIFQFTYLGAPAIYYGDEVGMEGGKDPDCRRPMIWDPEKQNQDLLNLYKTMIKIRRSYPALQRGSFRVVYTDDKRRIFAFEREYEGERIISVINNSDDVHTLTIPFEEWGIKGEVYDLLNGGVYNADKTRLELKPNFGAVLLVK